MKRNFKMFLAIGLLLFAIGIPSVFAADGAKADEGGLFDSIVNWVVGLGVPGILAFVFGIWKKGVKLIGKVAGALVRLMDSVGNLLMQVYEAKLALRNKINELKAYAADGNLDKDEIKLFINGIEQAAEEIEDIPKAIKELKAEFKAVILEFKKQ